MRILKNFPLFRGSLDFLFVLEGLSGAAEIDRITAVFLLAENIRHGSRTPVVRNGRRLAAISADAEPVLGRRRHFGDFQAFCDLRGTQSVYTPSKDLPNDFRGVFVYNPAVFVLRVFEVAERRIGGQRCAGHSLAFEHIPHFLTGILRVPLVEQVLHRNDLTDALGCVNIIHDSNIANAEIVEPFFQKLSHNKPISTQTRMVFDDQGADKSLFCQFHDFCERRSCKVRARPAVVNEHAGVLEAVLLRVFFEDGLLIFDAS